MTKYQKKKSKQFTQKSLAEKLRHLPEVEFPEKLEAMLLDAIPVRQKNLKRDQQLRWYRTWDFGVTAAAAVLIFALMLLVNYVLSTPSRISIMEFDTSLCYTGLYQNGFMYDQNNTYLEKYVPYQLK